MRNILKATTLENKFPLFTVENGCIVSKDADITVAFRVELPELFTVTAAEYEAIHSAWNKAVKVLPDYSIVHKQDWFIKENYAPDIQKDDLSFLSRSFERHFNERPFLNHTCYLFLTKTTKERSRMQSNFSTLCRGFLVPKEIKDKETVTKFLEAVGQFESIMNDSGFITLTRLTSDEITGTKETAGIVEKYFSLSQTDTTTLKDIQLNAEDMRIGDDILCLHTLSDAEDMPGKVGTDTRYEKLSTDRSDCRLSFASPVGVLLSCNHIYNQYIFIDDDNNLPRYTYDDFFTMAMYDGDIYKTRNLTNRSMMQMFPDPDDRKRAQDSIQNRLESFDKNLWVPSREEVIAAREAREAAEAEAAAKAEGQEIADRDGAPADTQASESRTSRGRRGSATTAKKSNTKKAATKKTKVRKPKAPKSSSAGAARSVRRRK